MAIRKINLKLHNLTNFLTNSTHSICGCQRLATFALLAPPAGKNYNILNGPNISEQNDILVGIMAAIILILAIVVVAILSCYCRKRKVSNLCLVLLKVQKSVFDLSPPLYSHLLNKRACSLKISRSFPHPAHNFLGLLA